MSSDPRTAPYRAEILRRVAARVPLGLAVFLVCLALSAVFEVLHFPERGAWMGTFAAGFVLLTAGAWGLVRRRPGWSVPVMVGFVNLVGIGLNVYHVVVGASVAMCVWQLTALLASSAVILPWGGRSQALATLGTLLSYPLHLEAGTADPLTWGAGGTYLLVVLALSVFGASLFAAYLRTDLRLSDALSEREARLQSYFDLSLVGTAILSPDGTCSEVNDELCRMLGYSRAELRRLSWPALVHPEEHDAAGALLTSAFADSGAAGCRDMRCARKDGETIHAIVSLRGLPGAEGAIDHVMLVVQDITGRKRTETERERYLVRAEEARHEAEEASRAKDAFLATVSHELRTPLTPILAWSGILREGGLGGTQTMTALAAIERSARTQAQLIDDLLDVSRIVSGEWRLTPRPVELGAIVQAAVDVVRPAAEAKGVEVVTTFPARPVSVQGDPERLQQVIWNLVANAVKFTPRGGQVEVGFERADPHARISVRDTGEGISPEFLPHVFDRFRQADSSSTRRFGGLGLGLAIVRSLVDLHGGTVHAESAGEGLGATFTVELPLACTETQTAGAELVHAVPPASLGGLRVLVVDDDSDSNAVVSVVLASCGAEVRTALSTREALELAGRWQPDVLVSDIAMPGEDGLALLEKLRARGGPLGRLPAVALTACAGPGDRRRLLAAGFQAYVAKPFRPAELAAVVESTATA